MNYKISIIIPSYNTALLTCTCIKKAQSALKSFKYEIIVVDNHSTDHTVPVLKNKFPNVTLITNSKNQGFARAVNQGIKKSSGDYILLLNTDAFLDQKIDQAIEYLDNHPTVGLLSPGLVYPDQKLQANFGNYPTLFTELLQLTKLYKILPWGRVIIPNFFNAPQFKKIIPVQWLAGTCLFIRREVINSIGHLDDQFFMYLEDVDYCLRAQKAGFRMIYLGQVQIIHNHQASAKNTLTPWHQERKSLIYYWQKHYPGQIFGLIIIKIFSQLKLQAKKLKLKIKRENK